MKSILTGFPKVGCIYVLGCFPCEPKSRIWSLASHWLLEITVPGSLSVIIQFKYVRSWNPNYHEPAISLKPLFGNSLLPCVIRWRCGWVCTQDLLRMGRYRARCLGCHLPALWGAERGKQSTFLCRTAAPNTSGICLMRLGISFLGGSLQPLNATKTAWCKREGKNCQKGQK